MPVNMMLQSSTVFSGLYIQFSDAISTNYIFLFSMGCTSGKPSLQVYATAPSTSKSHKRCKIELGKGYYFKPLMLSYKPQGQETIIYHAFNTNLKKSGTIETVQI